MPYGIAKRVGGDTPSSDAWMERCVADVTAKGTSKPVAIAICKAQYDKKVSKQGGGK